MGVLFLMPRWEDASRGWMERMLLCLSSELTAIAVPDSEGNGKWGRKIPVVSLYPTRKEIRYFSRLFRLFRLSLETKAPKAETILRRTIREFPITHIFCQYGTFATRFMNVWQDTDIPLFIHFHGYDATFNLRMFDQPQRCVFADEYLSNIKKLEKRAVFIVNSKFTKSLLIKAGISERMMIKYFGVPVHEKKRIHERKTKLQILHLGRLVDFKSPDRTIRAFEIAKSQGLDATLVIAGDGPLRTMCELLRLRSPYKESIFLCGEVGSRQAQTLYSEADIFTAHNITGEITKQTECFGVSIVEAMAAGLPVVGTRSGGVVETVVHGETGILNLPGDVEAQADAFLHLAANPALRQKMGEAGRARVSAHFSPQQEANQLRTIMGLRSQTTE